MTESLRDSKYFVTSIGECSVYSIVRSRYCKKETAVAVIYVLRVLKNRFNSRLEMLFIINRSNVKWIMSECTAESVVESLPNSLKQKAIVREVTTSY